MPKGPRGEKRPADVIGNAVKVMRIATGEETEDPKALMHCRGNAGAATGFRIAKAVAVRWLTTIRFRGRGHMKQKGGKSPFLLASPGPASSCHVVPCLTKTAPP